MRRMTAAMSLLVGVLMTPAMLSAQAYKVDKYNIGGEGGTDYLTVGSGDGPRVRFARTHVMVVDGRPARSSATFRTRRACTASRSSPSRATASRRTPAIRRRRCST